jgi:hypothetical protein
MYVPIVYKGQTMADPLRLDILVDKGEKYVKDGIHRVANNLG